MRAHAAIISGPVAVDFFVPSSTWSHDQIDIYVPVTTYKHFLEAASTAFDWKPTTNSAKSTSTPLPETSLSTDADPVARSFGHTLVHVDRLNKSCFADNVMPFGGGLYRVLTDAAARGADVEDELDGDDETSGSDTGSTTASFNSFQGTAVWRRGFLRVQSYNTSKGHRINIFSSHSTNPITPLRFAWSSLMINFITPDACVCGCPTATLRRKGAFRISTRTAHKSATVQHYIDQGFMFHDYHLAETLDMWDYVFFGERCLLAMDFRLSYDSAPRPIPIQFTPRGWVANPLWTNMHSA